MWIVLALLTALFTSLKDVLAKKIITSVDVYVVAWAWPFFTLPVLWAMFIPQGIPVLGGAFWPALCVSTVILTWASVLFFKALRASDLSLCMPILAFTPLFLLLTSPLILGEFPRPLGLAGILLIVGGSYLINIQEMKKGLWAPFQGLLRERGPRYMMIIALIYSVGANVDKIGVENSSPLMWSLSVNTLVSLLLGILMLNKVRGIRRQMKATWPVLLLMGTASGIAFIFQMYAIKLTIVPYIISLKRTSVFMSSLFGVWLFKEPAKKQRLIGAAIMMMGVLILTFFS